MQQVYKTWIRGGNEEKRTGNYLGDWILNRIVVKNKNALIVVVGDTGSGKSYTSMRLAEMIMAAQGRKFDVNTHMFFNPESFVSKLNDGVFMKGDCIVLEEVGVEHSSRTWYDKQQLSFNFILQTFRFKNLCVIMNTPSFKFVDSQARELFHGVLNCEHITGGHVVTQFKSFQRNHVTGDIYTKYLRIKRKEWNEYKKLKFFEFTKPATQTCRDYEKLAKAYKNEVIRRSLMEKYKGKILLKEDGTIFVSKEDRSNVALWLVQNKKLTKDEAAKLLELHKQSITNRNYKMESLKNTKALFNTEEKLIDGQTP